MASNYWIKLYQDILRDPKMGRLSDSAFRRCIELFLLAGEQEERNGLLPQPHDIAWELRISDEQLTNDLHELTQAGIVTLADGRPFVIKFQERQQAVSGAERVAQFRKRNKPVTQEPAAGNGHVTKSYTDIDKDIDKEKDTYIHPDPEPIAAIKTALSKTTKTPLWADTEEQYDQAAYMLIGWDCTPDDITGFGKWWQIASNGHYAGKPALKSLLQEFPNFLAARTPLADGVHHEPDLELEAMMQQMEAQANVSKR